jgi:tRNA (adenine-N(1)-)-methyltransferase non-catalytic subunit
MSSTANDGALGASGSSSSELPQGDHVKESDIVQPGNHVILQFENGDDSYVFAQMKKGARVKIRRKQYSVDRLIGAKYGSVFEVEKRGFKRVADKDPDDSIFELNAADADADNRHLTDTNTAQKLHSDEITELKSSGASGEEILHKLVKNSSTFHTKTKFSQAKYLKRKRQKYAPRLRIIRPCGQTLVQCMYARNSHRILKLRPDGLAQLLHRANVYSGSTVMVVDSTSSLVLGTVMERLGGHGVALNIYLQSHPSLVILDRFNFKPNEKAVNVNYPFGRMDRQRLLREGKPLPDEYNGTKKSLSDRDAYTVMKSGVDSLIMVTDVDIPSIASTLIPFLSPGQYFAIFSPFMQGLLEAYTTLKESGLAVHLQLTETWLREIQILDGRTRPSMTMEDGGGYILSGICTHTKAWADLPEIKVPSEAMETESLSESATTTKANPETDNEQGTNQ